MCDDPYYYGDGRAKRLMTKQLRPEDEAFQSSLPPNEGEGLSNGRTIVRSNAERLDTDTDMPLTTKVSRLRGLNPTLPLHTANILVHDSPEMSVAQLSEVVKFMDPEDLCANTERELPPPPEDAPPPALADALGIRDKRIKRKQRRTGRVQDNSKSFVTESKGKSPGGQGGEGSKEQSEEPSLEAALEPTGGRKKKGAGVGRGGAERRQAKKEKAKNAAMVAPYQTRKIVISPSEPISELVVHHEVQPGLVLVKGMMDVKTQQWIVDETFRLGENPPGLSGGFYKAGENGNVELNQSHRGNFREALDTFAPHFKDLCLFFFQRSRTMSECLPDMEAHWCNFNFYSENSGGIKWHRDGDESKERILAGTGRPVVSFSLGDSCDFRWKNRTHEEDNVIRLDSGDVLIFGGPSRGILHSVTKIHPNSCPSLLRMRRGRLNLTYRHDGGSWTGGKLSKPGSDGETRTTPGDWS